MAVMMKYEWTGVTPEQYDEVRALVGWLDSPRRADGCMSPPSTRPACTSPTCGIRPNSSRPSSTTGWPPPSPKSASQVSRRSSSSPSTRSTARCRSRSSPHPRRRRPSGRPPSQELRSARLVAVRAVERGVYVRGPFGVVEDPGSHLERRVVADVLAVAAVQLRHPCAAIVLVKAGDHPLHVRQDRRAARSAARAFDRPAKGGVQRLRRQHAEKAPVVVEHGHPAGLVEEHD